MHDDKNYSLEKVIISRNIPQKSWLLDENCALLKYFGKTSNPLMYNAQVRKRDSRFSEDARYFL